MKDNKQPYDPFLWEQGIYQTGSTSPPKSRGGLIAILLVLVIFLSGVSTALGLMNIRLFRQINLQQEAETSPVAFSQGNSAVAAASADDAIPLPLGFSGQEVPVIWQQYYDLPAGICVMEVDPESSAFGLLHSGDILTRAAGVSISDIDTLLALLTNCQAGDTVEVTLFRDGQELLLELSVETE